MLKTCLPLFVAVLSFTAFTAFAHADDWSKAASSVTKYTAI